MQVLLAATILAVIAGLALPSYAEKLRKERCRRNVKLMTWTIQMYCNDFDEFYPIHGQNRRPSRRTLPPASSQVRPASALAD